MTELAKSARQVPSRCRGGDRAGASGAGAALERSEGACGDDPRLWTMVPDSGTVWGACRGNFDPFRSVI